MPLDRDDDVRLADTCRTAGVALAPTRMKIVGATSSVAGRAGALAEQAAHFAVGNSARIAEPILSEAHAALWSIRRPEETPRDLLACTSADGRERFWLAGEGVAALDPIEPFSGAPDKAFDAYIARVEGDYLGVSLEPQGRVRLRTDTWGLSWTHLRRFPDGVVFASDASALCKVENRPDVDRESLLLELALGFCPDERSIFEGIQVLPPGSIVTLDGDTIEVHGRERFNYGNEWFNATDEEKFERLDGLFRRMGERAIKLAGGPVTISLSAGYDSRYALATLHQLGAVGKLLTFGDAASDEVIDAHHVATSLGTDGASWENFAIPETHWPEWTRMIQSLGNAGIVQWCGWAERWLEFVRTRAPACAIGYLGDALSGKRLDVLHHSDGIARELDPEIGTWARRWIAWELDMAEWAQSPLLRPDARRDLLRAASTRFASLLASASFAADHQQALHLNLVGRQRRWVGTQPALMSEWLRPLTFFVDREYRQFWRNVGVGDLLGQSLYLRYARSRHPSLFPAEYSAASKLASRIIGRATRTAGILLRRPAAPRRPPPILRAALLRPHYHRILEALEACSPQLNDIIDIVATRNAMRAYAAGHEDPRLTTAMLIRCINVMHLLALARAPSVSGA